jgi:hypothetical protein
MCEAVSKLLQSLGASTFSDNLDIGGVLDRPTLAAPLIVPA